RLALAPSQAPRELVAVHARQADIHHGDLRREHLRGLQRLAAVMHRAHVVAFQAQEHCNAFGGIAVVVHDEDALAGRPEHAGALRPARRLCAHAAYAWEPHAKERTLPRAVARRLHPAEMQLDEALHHREPHAEAALAAVERPLALREKLEY